MADLTPDPIETIIKLGLRELLSYINLKKLSGEVLEYAKKRLRELWYKKQYGFTPSKDEATILRQISQTDLYLRLKFCLGQHWSLPLIKVGIYVSNLNKEGQDKLVQQIKDYIFQKYGIRGIRIMELGSTGIIESIIELISDLKIRKNYTREDLVREFENILFEWKEITLFVKNEHTIDDVIITIKRKMEMKKHLFFVFAFGNASKIAMSGIAKANTEGLFSQEGYLFSNKYWINKRGSEIYSWTFESVELF